MSSNDTRRGRTRARYRNLDKEDNSISGSTWGVVGGGFVSRLVPRHLSGDRLRGGLRARGAKMKGDMSSRLVSSRLRECQYSAIDFISPLLLLFFLIYTRDTRYLYGV